MARRIGLAQALINNPDLILLDEPTTGLDPIGTREMKDLILSLKQQGKTVLLCSHLLADVQDVCDRITILFRGQMQTLGDVRDLLQVKDVTHIETEGLNECRSPSCGSSWPGWASATRGSPTRRRRWKTCSCGSSATTRRAAARQLEMGMERRQ